MSHILKDGQRWSIQKDGTVLKLDADEIVQDGQAVRVPMIMQDGKAKADTPSEHHARPRQGQTATDSAQVNDARAAYIERQQNAWRDSRPGQQVQQQHQQQQHERQVQQQFQQPVFQQPTGDGTTSQYRAYCRRLEDGWKERKSHPRVGGGY